MTRGRGGASGRRVRALPADLSDARLDRRERVRRGRELRSLVGGVEARRDPDPDPPPRRRGPDLHPQPERDHATRCPGSSRRVRRLPVTQAVFDGEALWMSEHGPAAFQDTVSRIDSEAPPEGIVTFLFDILHARRRRPARHAARGARRAARGDRAAAQDPERDHVGPRDGTARPRRGAARGTRGRRRQGRRVAVQRGSSRQGVAQGEAGADLRPRRARRRVGPRAPAGLAVEPPPRRARPAHGRVRDGRKVLQGADRRAPRLADEGAARARDRAGRGSRCWCARSSWSRSRWTACSPRRATRAASRCASRGSSAIGRTRAPRRRTRSTTCAPPASPLLV